MKKGTLISFSGVDGSGKTTQVDMLVRLLKKEHKSVKQVKTFNYFLFRPFLAVAKKKIDSVRDSGIKVNKNPILKLWFIIAFFDFWTNYLLKIKPLKKKHTIIISDRFFLDMAVALVTYGYMPEDFFPYFIRLLPKPDKLVILILSPKIAMERSREFRLEYYKKQNKLYSRAAEILNLKKVNAQKRPKEICDEIVSIFQRS